MRGVRIGKEGCKVRGGGVYGQGWGCKVRGGGV